MGEPGGEVRRDSCRLLVGERRRHRGRQSLVERPAGHVLEHQVRPALELPVVEHAHDVRVRQRGRRPGLALESRHRPARPKQLDRDRSLELQSRASQTSDIPPRPRTRSSSKRPAIRSDGTPQPPTSCTRREGGETGRLGFTTSGPDYHHFGGWSRPRPAEEESDGASARTQLEEIGATCSLAARSRRAVAIAGKCFSRAACLALAVVATIALWPLVGPAVAHAAEGLGRIRPELLILSGGALRGGPGVLRPGLAPRDSPRRRRGRPSGRLRPLRGRISR